ncbi:D-tyrosyl-tRNA(Tyr) deacylase [Dietzia natronolimnaea]|uniref:D-aminoacyl-tRNA deacylase n=1 Tax=Dietzia natronolimnaea TaxID=161920 RepID=A0A2A2WM64_9ACTN|nr:D-aminoacyl-tRNA deacylase [Dietzia natronolimnaea]PAY22282.1 D-tyrosyl-tRNA(Tyr) deacylase [Dietzia natronolimnaea]
MRAVISRVTEASVTVDGAVVGALPRAGLLVLLGVSIDDDETDVSTMVRKIAELRILRGRSGDDDDGAVQDAAGSVGKVDVGAVEVGAVEVGAVEAGAPVLVVSQFTLMGSTAKGRRPSWSRAAPGEQAEAAVDAVVRGLRERGLEVATGEFGAMMQVSSVNDGPFTVLVDTSASRVS